MTGSFQSEVRKLCTKEKIASEIITNERDEYEEKERRRMLAEAEHEREQVSVHCCCVRGHYVLVLFQRLERFLCIHDF